MTKEISFLHSADLHLDSPFKGLKTLPENLLKEVRESTFFAFNRLIQEAIRLEVDFILIVGDLFDNEKQSLKSQIRLKKGFEELYKHDIQVFISYGNHDYINGNMHEVDFPDNVFVFPDETVQTFSFKKKEEVLATIYGFSYENQAVLENKVDDFQINDQDTPFHVAMLHGSASQSAQHDTYAPFQLSELKEKHFDYWALGHIHQHAVLSNDPPVIYSGNIQGRHRNEAGERGCYYVQMRETETSYQFLPLEHVQFEVIRIQLKPGCTLHHLEALIQTEIVRNGKRMVYLIIESTTSDIKIWEQNHEIEDLIEIVNESQVLKSNWSFIYQYKLEFVPDYDPVELKQGEHFVGEIIRQLEKQEIIPFLDDVYKNKKARKYIDQITTDEAVEIKQEAEHLLLMALLKEDRAL